MLSNSKEVWVFNSGPNFSGNPKWLFIYLNKYHKDTIETYWLTESNEIIELVRKLGFKAYKFSSSDGLKLKQKANVFVVNQVKEHIPEEMMNVKILNLWHGVGGKTIERKLDFGFIRERVAKKYIKYHEIYKNQQLFLVSSERMETHFKEHCGIDDDKVIRAGYPCCILANEMQTFDHQFIKDIKNKNKKLAMYAPTFRYSSPTDFFNTAIPDMERLEKKLKETNTVLIFKLHPMMEQDYAYQAIKETYKNSEHFIFWNNDLDTYEIFKYIDLAIVDYSSIFYDLMACGVKNFGRYVFDIDNEDNISGLNFDYYEMTTGEILSNFDELVAIFDKQLTPSEQEIARLTNEFWSYSDGIKSIEHIIEKTRAFKIDFTRTYPTLYSFDVFDTLIQRKSLIPTGIFYYVKDQMSKCDLNFDQYLIENYPRIRRECESNVREFYKKSQFLRNDARIEITYKKIFEHMENIYDLDHKQIQFLMDVEIQGELLNCEPIQHRVDYVLELLRANETVILISDMYLPKDVIVQMLEKACPDIAHLPLYVSSEYGNQKSTKLLFLDIYNEIDYNFKEWQHFGDNKHADGNAPKSLGINTNVHTISKFNKYENFIVRRANNYDAHIAATLLARFRENNEDSTDYYAYAHVSMYFVPYVSWVIEHALKNKLDCLYFVSRDGHHLKRIADKIIDIKKLNIKTKYIYGSRKLWRVPSFVNKIDEDFFKEHGNFTSITSFESLLKNLALTEVEFNEIFPELIYLKGIKEIDEHKNTVIEIVKNSKKYEQYLLAYAKEKREVIQKYLLQEIDFNENYAFVEFWGRGYNQDCLGRIINDMQEVETQTKFYYMRSIYPTFGNSVRYNFTSNLQSLIFIEAIFANLPYESVGALVYDETGKIVPEFKVRENNPKLHEALERYLVQFTEDLLLSQFNDFNNIARKLFILSMDYYRENQTDPYILNNLSTLKDSVVLYEKENEYAPALTVGDCYNYLRGRRHKIKTKSVPMSVAKSAKPIRMMFKLKHSKTVKKSYDFYYKYFRKYIKKVIK